MTLYEDFDEATVLSKTWYIELLAGKNIYIGSTIRKIHDRIKEHLNSNKSSVYKHLISCQDTRQDIQVSIITRDNDNVNLRLKEAFHIRKETPTINSRDECAELTDILF